LGLFDAASVEVHRVTNVVGVPYDPSKLSSWDDQTDCSERIATNSLFYAWNITDSHLDNARAGGQGAQGLRGEPL
jgi:hypothetical protein